jgi:hypothetical protein
LAAGDEEERSAVLQLPGSGERSVGIIEESESGTRDMEKASRSTEEILADDIQIVQAACIANQLLHLSRCFTKSPGQFAVVTTSVTCPDGIAKEMHARLDATVVAFFAEKNIVCDGRR